MNILSSFRRRYSKKIFESWQTDIKDRNWDGFVTAILKTHYDPSYARSAASRQLTDISALTATRLDEDDIIRLANELTAQDI